MLGLDLNELKVFSWKRMLMIDSWMGYRFDLIDNWSNLDTNVKDGYEC